jgi:hypothetical protein
MRLIPDLNGYLARSVVHFNLVVLKLNDHGATQNFQQHGNTFAGYALDQALYPTQCGVLESNRLACFEVAELLQRSVVTVLFKLADAVHDCVMQHRWLEPEAHDSGNAFGVAYNRDALIWLAGPEKNVSREHGLKQCHWALLCFFEFFIQGQINLKGLLPEIDLRDLLLPRLGVGKIPAF